MEDEHLPGADIAMALKHNLVSHGFHIDLDSEWTEHKGKHIRCMRLFIVNAYRQSFFLKIVDETLFLTGSDPYVIKYDMADPTCLTDIIKRIETKHPLWPKNRRNPME